MSTLDLDKVSPATAAALQLGDSGDTITVPSGVTLTATDATVSLPATITASTEIKTNKISPGSGTAFTFGDSGDTFNLPSGTTLTNSGTASGFGDCVLLSTQTVTNQASISFTTGIDNTYKEYVFVFIDINPATDGVAFTWNGSTDGGSNYNVSKTSTAFLAQHKENDATANLGYQTGMDLPTGGSGAGATNFQMIAQYVGDDAEQCVAGNLHIFNPSSTTYVKNWFCRANASFDQNGSSDPRTQDIFTAGYMNLTTAVDAIQFKMASGNFDGTIKMYGYT
jgi:hypothetical protein